MSRVISLLIISTFMLSCAMHKLTRQAEDASNREQWDHAFKLWQQVLEEKPGNPKAELNVNRARLNASLSHLDRALSLYNMERFEEAAFETQLTLGYDPKNQIALDLKEKIKTEMSRKAKEKQSLDIPEEEIESISSFPSLEPSHWDPIDLLIPKPQPVRQIYQMLGRNYGINVLIDSEIKNDKLAIELKEMDFLKALDTLLILNRHFFKVVDSKTIIILKDNKNNRDRFDNQIIKTYYLSNVTPKDLKEHLRALGDLKEFGVNEELNAITIKGTPEQITLADRLIAANDKALPEVVIEVELLEVSKTAMREVGLLPVSTIAGQSPYAIGFTADPVSQDGDSDSGGIRGFFPNLSSEDILTILPAVAINFLKETGDSTQVANPQLRVTAGSDASILIGQEVPTASTSFTPIGVNNNNNNNQFGGQPLTTFNYQEVGIKLNIKPRVHHNQEITLELDFEMSSIISSGLQPTFGKRKVTTTIRLKDGETNVLAGLLTNDERRSLTGIAGLADIPLLGRLFSNDDKVIRQTDIIMTLRPVIVRNANLTAADVAPYEIKNLSLSSLYKGKSKAKSVKNNKVLSMDGADESPMETESQQENLEEENLPPEEELKEEEASDTVMFAFTPTFVEARMDQQVDVQVFLANAVDLEKGEIAISFPKDLFIVESVDPGTLGLSAAQRPLVTPAWNHDLGRISIIISGRKGQNGYQGSGILANLRFKAIAQGSGEIRFESIDLQNKEKEIEAQWIDLPVEINP